MKIFVILIQMIIVLTLQSTLVSSIEIFGIAPDLVLIFIVHMALKHGASVGVFCGFFCGLTEDIYGPIDYMGAATLSKLCVGYFVGQLEETFLKLDFIPKLALLALSFFVCDFIYAIGANMSKESISTIFINQSLPESIYTLLFGTLIFYVLDIVKQRK